MGAGVNGESPHLVRERQWTNGPRRATSNARHRSLAGLVDEIKQTFCRFWLAMLGGGMKDIGPQSAGVVGVCCMRLSYKVLIGFVGNPLFKSNMYGTRNIRSTKPVQLCSNGILGILINCRAISVVP